MRDRRGISLMELMVSIGIMSIVIAGAFQVFREGILLFRTNQAAAEAQSSAIKALGMLNAELSNSRHELIRLYDSPPGVVFASSITPQGQAQFDQQTGQIYWQRLICYYFEAHPTDPSLGRLIRKERPLDDGDTNGAGRTGNTDVEEVADEMDDQDTADFAAASDTETRTLGHDVCGFEVTEFTGEVDDGAGTRDFLGGASVERKRSYDIRLEAGHPTDKGPASYYIRVDSRVTPRG